MNSGLWRLSPHGICLGPDGRASDGNHRLSALAESDLNGAWFLVCDWMAPAAELRVDRGSSRTLADFAGVDVCDGAVLTTIASLLSIGGGNRRDPEEMRPIVTTFMPFIGRLKAACPTMRKGRSQGAVRCGFIAKMIKDPDSADFACSQYRELVLNGPAQRNSLRILGNQLDMRSLAIHEIAGKTYCALNNPDYAKVIYKQEDAAEVRLLFRAALSGA